MPYTSIGKKCREAFNSFVRFVPPGPQRRFYINDRVWRIGISDTEDDAAYAKIASMN